MTKENFHLADEAGFPWLHPAAQAGRWKREERGESARRKAQRGRWNKQIRRSDKERWVGTWMWLPAVGRMAWRQKIFRWRRAVRGRQARWQLSPRACLSCSCRTPPRARPSGVQTTCRSTRRSAASSPACRARWPRYSPVRDRADSAPGRREYETCLRPTPAPAPIGGAARWADADRDGWPGPDAPPVPVPGCPDSALRAVAPGPAPAAPPTPPVRPPPG